nr:metal-dependent transcriptional regulator [candidate division Zixibacteria bacterium]
MPKIVLTSSQEDYLEAILHIEKENGAARTKEISKRLRITYSAVTKALQSLAKKNLVYYKPYGLIRLTPTGKRIANDVVNRHTALKEFLIKVLHVDEDEADDAACKMEHAISKNIINRIIKFVEYVENCPHVNIKWLDEFGYHCKDLDHCDKCSHCDDIPLKDIEKSK